MTHFTRTFHPVGQGVFYTEIHWTNGHQFRVVYDCGSAKSQDWLRQRIESGIGKNPTVDLLFISHFDKDHISGIKFLNPKTIVIPFFSDEELILLDLHNLVYRTAIQTDFIRNLRSQFNGRLIEILPMLEEMRIEGLERPVDIEEIPGSADNRFQSGTVLGPSRQFPNWIYIPFNPNLNQRIFQNFKTALLDAGLDFGKLKNHESDYVVSHLKEIKKAFKKVGKLNDHSMLVYSGPLPGSWGWNHVREYPRYRCGYCDYCDYCDRLDCNRRPAAMFTGDILLKVKTGNGNGVLNRVYSAMPEELISYISTIQVPHHGSIHNYHADLKSYYDQTTGPVAFEPPMTYVISAGESNTFGHPSWWVIGDLMECGCHRNIRIVSENPISGLVQDLDY